MKPYGDRIREDAKRAVASIKSQKLALEPELLLTKWPDHAFLTPLQATKVFGREYCHSFKATLSKYYDRDVGARATGLDLRKLLDDKQTLSSVWQARQVADRFGIPYRMYIDFSLEFACRTQRGYLPQPNQLGPVGKAAKAWLTQFEEHKIELEEAGFLNRIQHVAYTASAFRNLPNQVSVRNLLLARATSETAAYHRTMRRFVDELQILTLQDFRDRLDPEVFDRALELLECERRSQGIPDVLSSIITDHLKPSCFSLQPVGASGHPVCKTCPLLADCAEETRRVTLELARDGFQTRDDVDRAGNANRQRKFRARRNALKQALPAPVVLQQQ